MTQAAEQCREYIEAKWPGTPIGRFACRDTAGGAVSQHSAYNGYDSNALDIFAPEHLDRTQRTVWIQDIVDDLTPFMDEWSGRILLWQVPDHYGHAHIDFWPTCLEHKWCGRPIRPEWKYSNGMKIQTTDPRPQNGDYEGVETMPTIQWHQMIDALFAADGEFQGDADYWKQLPEQSPEWTDFWAAFVRMIGDST